MLQLYLMHSNFFKSAVHGYGRGKRLGVCLVLQPYASVVVSLQRVSMFHYAGYVQAWTRHAPRYMPSVCCICYGLCCMLQ